ncbi:MAG: hypothetical protein WAM39_16345 [Bryobacteraceae bacterium]
MALVGDLGCFENVAVFPVAQREPSLSSCASSLGERWREISLYRPNILAADPATLAKFAEYVFCSVWETPSVDTAVFALTVIGRQPMTEEHRLLSWRAFRVPVYELLVDADEGVLAAECEAHEGWHVHHPQLRFDLQTAKIVFQKHGLSASPVPSGLTADGLDGICVCGGVAPLLRNVRAQHVEEIRVQAARA